MGYVTLKQLYTQLKNNLSTNEARILIEHFLDCDYSYVVVNPDKIISDDDLEKIEVAVKQRLDGKPLQYILGKWEFFGREFFVGDGVLIPRQDTEVLCETVLNLAPNGATVLDICSGTGCIPITLKAQRDDLSVFALEKYDKAFEYLTRNIELNGVSVKTIKADALLPDEKLFNTLPSFDVIVSNPPYLTSDDMKSLQKEVEFEPETALYGGDDGLLFYRELTRIWKQKLTQNGILAFEIGVGQQDDVTQILEQNGFYDVCKVKDLCDIIRVIYATKR